MSGPEVNLVFWGPGRLRRDQSIENFARYGPVTPESDAAYAYDYLPVRQPDAGVSRPTLPSRMYFNKDWLLWEIYADDLFGNNDIALVANVLRIVTIAKEFVDCGLAECWMMGGEIDPRQPPDEARYSLSAAFYNPLSTVSPADFFEFCGVRIHVDFMKRVTVLFEQGDPSASAPLRSASNKELARQLQSLVDSSIFRRSNRLKDAEASQILENISERSRRGQAAEQSYSASKLSMFALFSRIRQFFGWLTRR